MKRRRFCDVTDIIKNATEELKRLSQKGYVSKIFTVAGISVCLQNWNILKEK
jgi:hypothetical protein